jgi:hypothetical protein
MGPSAGDEDDDDDEIGVDEDDYDPYTTSTFL